jgi:hypothetical protein
VPDTHPSSPSTAPETDLDIHYALRAEPFQGAASARRHSPLCGPILGHIYMLAIPAGLLLLFAVLEYLPIPRSVSIPVYVVAIVVVIGPLILRGRNERRENNRLAPHFAKEPDERRRLRVAGPAARLERLRVLMESEPEEFEPRIFRVGRARRAGFADVAVFTILFAVLFAAFFGAKELLHVAAPYLGHTIVFLSLTLTFLIWSFLWPTYLRFVPGRLDILTYGILGGGRGGGRPTVRSFDLRTTPILVILPGNAALFTDPGNAPEILDVGPTFDRDPFSFERAILAAARSTTPTPPLPDDELIG